MSYRSYCCNCFFNECLPKCYGWFQRYIVPFLPIADVATDAYTVWRWYGLCHETDSTFDCKWWKLGVSFMCLPTIAGWIYCFTFFLIKEGIKEGLCDALALTWWFFLWPIGSPALLLDHLLATCRSEYDEEMGKKIMEFYNSMSFFESYCEALPQAVMQIIIISLDIMAGTFDWNFVNIVKTFGPACISVMTLIRGIYLSTKAVIKNKENGVGCDPLVDNGEPGVKVRALHDYKAAESDELDFKAGDTFEKLRGNSLRVEGESWWKGRKDGKVGLYPSKYVAVIELGVKVKALHDYEAAESDELDFKAGDTFEKLEDEDEQGWCTGRKDGKVGLYPAGYVAVI